MIEQRKFPPRHENPNLIANYHRTIDMYYVDEQGTRRHKKCPPKGKALVKRLKRERIKQRLLDEHQKRVAQSFESGETSSSS